MSEADVCEVDDIPFNEILKKCCFNEVKLSQGLTDFIFFDKEEHAVENRAC